MIILSVTVAALFVLQAVINVIQRWFSSRIGEGLIFDMRTQVFDHVVQMPIAFFTRTQTGKLVSRLNSDVIGARQAFTSTLSTVLSNLIGLVLVLAAMIVLSWQLTLAALIMLPIFLIPAKIVGRKLRGSHASADTTQRRLVGDRDREAVQRQRALLVKLFGRLGARPVCRTRRRRRDVSVKIAADWSVPVYLVGIGRRTGYCAGIRRGRVVGH